MTDPVTPERDTGRIEAIRWAVTSEKGGWMSEPQAKADVRYILAEYDSLAAQLDDAAEVLLAARRAYALLLAGDAREAETVLYRALAAYDEQVKP